MIKALIKKELKKTKVVFLALISLCFLSLASIYLNINNAHEYNKASDILFALIQNGEFDFSYLQIFIVFLGAGFAFYQYNAEIKDARIRLHFHLPLNQNFLIHFLIVYALVIISFSFLFINLIFFFILTKFYSLEVFYALESKLFLAYILSVLAYFAISIFIVSPKKKEKIASLVLAILLFLIYIDYSKNFFEAINLYYLFIFIFIAYYQVLFNAFKTYTQGYIK